MPCSLDSQDLADVQHVGISAAPNHYLRGDLDSSSPNRISRAVCPDLKRFYGVQEARPTAYTGSIRTSLLRPSVWRKVLPT